MTVRNKPGSKSTNKTASRKGKSATATHDEDADSVVAKDEAAGSVVPKDEAAGSVVAKDEDAGSVVPKDEDAGSVVAKDETTEVECSTADTRTDHTAATPMNKDKDTTSNTCNIIAATAVEIPHHGPTVPTMTDAPDASTDTGSSVAVTSTVINRLYVSADDPASTSKAVVETVHDDVATTEHPGGSSAIATDPVAKFTMPSAFPKPSEYTKDEANPFDLDAGAVTVDYDKQLGKGNYGVVFAGTLEGTLSYDDLNHRQAAVKMLPQDREVTELEQQDFWEEAKFLCSIQKRGGHDNIIHFFGYVVATDMMMLTEFAPRGSLLGYLRQYEYGDVSQRLARNPVLTLNFMCLRL